MEARSSRVRFRDWFGAALTLGSFLFLAWAERRRPLRARVENKLAREGRNLAVAGLGAAALHLAGAPAIKPLTRLVERKRWGLLPRLRLPRWMEIPTAMLLMDYTFYVWHAMAHRLPWLWRFHVVHHADLDLDASTALRFHFGELLAGVPWQAGQVLLFGLTPRTYSVWQTAFLISILFHHSAVEIPVRWERRLSLFLVTPRMHGIHHSIVQRESDANWSSGLSLWDRLHKTLRLNVRQNQVTIGVPAYRSPESVALAKLIEMPFEAQPLSWKFRSGGEPAQHEESVAKGYLLP